MTTSPNHRFFGMMMIVIAVAGAIWLTLALYNVRQGGSFNWGVLAGFLLVLAAFVLARGPGRRSP